MNGDFLGQRQARPGFGLKKRRWHVLAVELPLFHEDGKHTETVHHQRCRGGVRGDKEQEKRAIMERLGRDAEAEKRGEDRRTTQHNW